MKKITTLISLLILGMILYPSSVHSRGVQLSEQQLKSWLRRFPEADADGDGKLTAEEAATYRKAAKAMREKGAKDPGASSLSTRELKFDPGWDKAAFPNHAICYKSPGEIMEIYKKGPVARSGPAASDAMSFSKPTDGGQRIVGVGHSFMAPAYKTLPLICKAAGFEQPLCLHTGGGVTGSARYKWEQENGIFEFDQKPQPKLLAAIANADWEAMLWGGYYSDRPEFYTCWIEFCTRYHPEMKFYLSDTWPQLYQLEELFNATETPGSESFFTDKVIDRMGTSKREAFSAIVETARRKTTRNVFIIPTTDALVLAAKRFNKGELPGVEGLHQVIGGKERSIWRDRTGHLGPGFERLEGYVFYATLYGKSPELIGKEIDFGGTTGFPGPELDRIFRQIAWKAVIGHPLSGVVDSNLNGIADHLE